ncbi:hypothetical protein ACLMJK_005509 [Lecanora helva]
MRCINAPSLLPTILIPLIILLSPEITTTTIALTLPTPSTLQPTTNLTTPSKPLTSCVASEAWSQFHHNIAPSCEAAVLKLSDDTSTYGPLPGTFTYHSHSSWITFPSSPHSNPIPLPKRYEYRSCVVAIVMMKMFENAPASLSLPELPRRKWPYVDKARWGELVEPASYVRATCGNGVGFAVVGRFGGVGVVILESGSVWDRFIQGRVVAGEEGEGLGGNGTAVA